MVLATTASYSIAIIPMAGQLRSARVVSGVLGKVFITVVFNGLLSWSIELYGTDLRGTAMGVLNVAVRFGVVSSPWIVKALTKIKPMAPFVLMGVLAFSIASILFTFRIQWPLGI